MAQEYVSEIISMYEKIAYAQYDRIQFAQICQEFIDGQTLKEYKAFVYRYLVEGSYHYSPEGAISLMERENHFIESYYEQKVDVSFCAVDIGYCCG